MTNLNHDGRSRAVVVTGGGTGIGRATARAFATRGDRVLVVGRSANALAETADGHDLIITLSLDITGPGAADTVVGTARREIGCIDVLVNNAAVAGFESLSDLNRDSLIAQVETNLVAPILLTQSSLDLLTARSGTVVNISSAGCIGLRGMSDSSVYAATKAGLDSLTRSWAVELAPRGIRVVGLAPGLVDTGVAVRAGMPQDVYESFLKEMRPRIPSGRVGDPVDIAWWIVTLSDPAGGYANGMVLAVDGALSTT